MSSLGLGPFLVVTLVALVGLELEERFLVFLGMVRDPVAIGERPYIRLRGIIAVFCARIKVCRGDCGGQFGEENALKQLSLIKLCAINSRLFLIGFSRGAFTARSLAGMLAVCGIGRADADEACRIYRQRDAGKRARLGARFRNEHHCHSADVYMLGVWDTVGAMGLPTRGPMGWATRARHGFHNVRLGKHIRHAYHALAINERRAPFTPSLWQHPVPDSVQTVQQMWFAGVHSNVGGGYADAGLSDITLQWMLEHVQRHGLCLNTDYVMRRVDPNVFGELRDSLSPIYRTPLTGLPRQRVIGSGAPGESVHLSAWQRWRAVSRPDSPPWE